MFWVRGQGFKGGPRGPGPGGPKVAGFILLSNLGSPSRELREVWAEVGMSPSPTWCLGILVSNSRPCQPVIRAVEAESGTKVHL